MLRTSRGLTSIALLGLACAPAPSVEPEPRSDPATLTEPQRDDFAAARARTERLHAWVGQNLDDERYQVPISDADLTLGAGPAARVTFVVFLDYQCPYSRRLYAELQTLVETYPTDVRVVIKHLPLAMHERARISAEAVLAAQAQGRGLSMHERVFAASTLSDADLRALAAAAKVPDLDRFWSDVSQGVHGPRVDADLELASKLAVSSTPSFFVNGAAQRGHKPFEQLRELYAAEVEVAERVIAAGAARDEVYGLVMAAAKPERERVAKPPAEVRPGKPDPKLRYAVPVDARPSRGPADALVTIIVFADFECPYCEKVQPTLAALEAQYGKDLRLVFRHQPLPMHKSAMSAALAASAADRQGEFWAMHDALFAASKEQLADPDYYVDLATQLGLDVKRFRKDLRDPKLAALVAEDQQIAKQFGAGGTPAFFINGRYLGGAQPLEAFAALVEEERGAAKAFAREHEVGQDQLYASMAAGWETEVEAPPIAARERQTIDLANVPGKGKLKQANITLVMCGDFDCPYTKRGVETVDQILASGAYKDEVGFYFLHFPLPMHKNAMGAHQAAIAAGNQGMFWEMHDLLFAEPKLRGRDDFVTMATQLGLDVDQFLADWASAATLDVIEKNKAACTKLGVTGTPNFFVNGRSMKGAQPLESISEVFDEELAGGYEATARREKAK